MAYAHSYNPPRAYKLFTTTGSGSQDTTLTLGSGTSAEVLKPQFAIVVGTTHGDLALDWDDRAGEAMPTHQGLYIGGGFSSIDDASCDAGIQLAVYY